ncbi:3-hydroxyacyl-CoA dehydrogenase NAD-binding domain-containing protein [Nocardia sp. CA-129566]|uniref:3-hydroxyacyl-CoA dehydrogenase NAD-binding domain-containing protein n=1 Tax=Nocardia sp. CA-129566 TaxID=3239976 RepID=UPI003D960D01
MAAIHAGATVAVIGAGTTGAGIPQMMVAGHNAVLVDAEPGRAGRSVNAMRKRLLCEAAKGRMRHEETEEAGTWLEADSLDGEAMIELRSSAAVVSPTAHTAAAQAEELRRLVVAQRKSRSASSMTFRASSSHVRSQHWSTMRWTFWRAA